MTQWYRHPHFTYTAYGPKGERIPLGDPIEVSLSMEENTPADAFAGVFPWKNSFQEQEPVFLEICGEGGETAFFGPIDELRHTASSGEHVLEITARSQAALLLDNEAIPQTYSYASLSILFERHGKPYGFTECRGETNGFVAPFTISKGMSEWEVLSLFCSRYLKASLQAKGNRLEACRSVEKAGEALRFGKDIPVWEFSIVEKLCERYSEILLRPEDTEKYAVSVLNENAQKLGIRRRRLLTGSWEQAEEALLKGEKNAFCVEIVCLGFPKEGIGTPASLELLREGIRMEGLYISELRYSLSGKGENCRCILRRKR